MKAVITGVESKTGKNGLYYHIYFKSDEGKSYFTYAYPEWCGTPVRNFHRWATAIAKHRGGKEVILKNLIVKKRKLIDADSLFEYC